MSMTTTSSPRWTRSGMRRRPIKPVPPATKVVMGGSSGFQGRLAPRLLARQRQKRRSVVDRAAPAGQVVGVVALCQLQRVVERALEMLVDPVAVDAAAQEIGPEKFAE